MNNGLARAVATDTNPSNSRYIIVNSNLDFWNYNDGWVDKISEASPYDDMNFELPIDGQWLHLDGDAKEIQGHYYKGDGEDRESVTSFDEADGYCVFIGIYNGDERTDIPDIFHRDFPKTRSDDPKVLAYIEAMQSRLGDLDEDYF